jgi:hypothetical protein
MAVVRIFRILLVVGGVLALAGVSLVFSSTGSSSSSTTSIPAGASWYMYYEFDLLGAGRLRGDYQETTGGSLDVFVLTQAQYDSFRNATDAGSLWSLGSSKGGTIDVSLPGSGTYFLVAAHSMAYQQVDQTVRLTLQVSGISPMPFGSGLALFGAGIAVVSWGMVRRKKRSKGVSTPAVPEPPQSL